MAAHNGRHGTQMAFPKEPPLSPCGLRLKAALLRAAVRGDKADGSAEPGTTAKEE